MAKNHNLAQSIYNASWNRFVQFISYKAVSAGKMVNWNINPKNTTQECSNCGHIKKEKEQIDLSQRIYHCNVCGLILDRDINSAKVIEKRSMLKRATLGQRESHARGDTASAIQQELQVASLNQEHTLQLQRKPTMFNRGRMSQDY